MPRETVEGAEPSAAAHLEAVDFRAYLTRKRTTMHRELLDFRLYLQQRRIKGDSPL